MRRALAVLAFLVFATESEAQPKDRSIYVHLRGHQTRIMMDSLVIWREVLASPAATYSASKAIIDSLKFPMVIADSARGILHSNFYTAPSRIAGRQRSWTVRCGAGIAGDYADTWRLSIAYVVFIEPSKDGGSRFGMATFGGVDPVEGVSKPSIPCPSTGNLEQMVWKTLQLRVLKAGN